MKKLTILFVLAAFSIGAAAQDFNSLYNRYSEMDGVSAVYISPTLFRMFGNLPDVQYEDESLNLTTVVRSLDGFYLLSTERDDLAAPLYDDVKRLMNRGRFELLMEAKQDGEATRFYMISKGDIVTHLIMISRGEGSANFIGMEGEMYRKDLEKILSKKRANDLFN